MWIPFHRYRVVHRGSDTIIQKSKWWQPGQDFSLAKACALRQMRYQREALDDAIGHSTSMEPCVPEGNKRCGVVTALRRKELPACPNHGGK